MAVLAFGFVGCADNDDPNEMIKEESSSTYSIDYTNDSEAVSRGYRSTNLKHAGGLVKVDFANGKATAANGVMGVIFDLEDGTNGKNFSIIGVTDAGKYYISSFRNVSDMQAANFGAGTNTAKTYAELLETTVPTEYVWPGASLGTTVPSGKFVNNSDNSSSVLIYYLDIVDTEEDASGKEVAKKNDDNTYNHTYTVFLLDPSKEYVVDNSNGTVSLKDDTNKESVLTVENAVGSLPYTDKSASVKQNKFAPYANVYAQKTLSGKWTVADTYKEANVVED